MVAGEAPAPTDAIHASGPAPRPPQRVDVDITEPPSDGTCGFGRALQPATEAAMAIARTRIARRARGRIDGLHRRRRDVVPPRGFEPLISTLKGWRPRPLDDGGTGARTAPSLAERPPQPAVWRSRMRMIAPATQPAPAIAARPPPTASAKARPSRPSMLARQIARAQ